MNKKFSLRQKILLLSTFKVFLMVGCGVMKSINNVNGSVNTFSILEKQPQHMFFKNLKTVTFYFN